MTNISEAEFISLPRARERCRLSSLTRTYLLNLLNRGEIQGVVLRRPGLIRGRRLIYKKSLQDYLHRLMAEQNGPQAGERRAS